jgi:anthranilate phosphoribosyltransferase
MKCPENVLEIHLDRLEEECQSLPKLLFLWGDKLAQAKRDARNAKNYLKLLAANMAKEIRENPKDFGLEKITEAALEQTVLVQEQYAQALADHSEAEHEEDVLLAFVIALKEKGEQIGNMTKLHGQMYWSKPDTSGLKEEERQQATKASKPDMGMRKPKTSK